MKVIDFFEARLEETGITIGTFDGIHIAHRKLINETLCTSDKWDLKPVVLTFSRHKYKRSERLTTLEEKLELLESLKVPTVILMGEDVFSIRAEEFLREHLSGRFGLRWLFLGYNHRFGFNREGDAVFATRYMDALEFSLTVLSPIKIDGVTVSSSRIRKLLKEGNLKMANRLLGYDYFITGEVMRGAGMGSKLGFPTANLKVPEEKLIPAEGVYATRVHVEGQVLPGAMHIGRRETLNLPPSIEVHIIGFQGDITGRKIRVELVEYLRRPMKFPTIDELRRQIEEDIERTLRVLGAD